jgi:DNA-binding MarR family transcriptional regulator
LPLRDYDLHIMKSRSGIRDHPWRFLSNHAFVLQCIVTNPTARIRDIATAVGITERAAAAIVSDLVEGGYLTKTREGRRNRYEIREERPLRHPLYRHRTVGDLCRFLEAP